MGTGDSWAIASNVWRLVERSKCACDKHDSAPILTCIEPLVSTLFQAIAISYVRGTDR